MIAKPYTIHVVGLGLAPDNLGPAARRIIEDAEVLAGGERHLGMFPTHPGPRLSMADGLTTWLDQVAETAIHHRVVVLASGDPNFYGIAGRLIDRVGVDHVRLHPNVTTVQVAFAELKESWAGVRVVSLHGRNIDALFTAVQTEDRVAIFTDTLNTPSRIAKLLIERGQTGWRMCVLENLGSPEARVTFHRLDELAGREFSSLNLVVLWRRDRPASLTLGAPDEDFIHEAGLITKSEIRSVIIGKLALRPGLTMWDLGAGCGSVGLEATLLLTGGRVWAVERSPERVEQIRANQAKFGAASLEVIEGTLPEALEGLPDPDRVFIGGGGQALDRIIQESWRRLKSGGVLVTAVVRLDSLDLARRTLTDLDQGLEIIQVQISRSSPLGDDRYLKPLNPVWLMRVEKTTEKEE